MARQGAALLPIGLAGAVLVVAYTPWITHHPLLCLLAPGLGFGPLMVAGTDVALTGVHHPATYVASLVPLLQVSGLLFLNQFPDVDADRAVGRRHIPMLWGRPRAARCCRATWRWVKRAWASTRTTPTPVICRAPRTRCR